ncbi:MAG: hypothetical protein ACE5I3_08640 [Phycisphaerae bacterium]
MLERVHYSVAVLLPTLVAIAMAETFSIDGPSPTHTAYPARTHYPDSLLLPDPNGVGEDIGGLGPIVNVSGTLFPRHTFGPYGLRDVDAISSNHGALADAPASGYRVIFSVRRNDTADDWTWVFDQADRNQEAGDLAISTDAFLPVLPDGPHVQMGASNDNAYFRNQADLDEVPCAPSDVVIPPLTPLDNLDGYDFATFNTDSDVALERAVYYSVSIETDTDFAAYIFYLPAGWDAPPADPLDLGPVYASRAEIGLTSGDDIDALAVFDADSDGVFSPGDSVLLSLRRGSTSLNEGWLYHDGPGGAFLPNGGSEACVFLVYQDAAGTNWLSRLATYEQLGLGLGLVAPYADIDALVLACPGDLDGDGDVDLADLAQLLANYGMTEGATYEDGDLDGDGDVDLTDLAALLSVYGAACPR